MRRKYCALAAVMWWPQCCGGEVVFCKSSTYGGDCGYEVCTFGCLQNILIVVSVSERNLNLNEVRY